MPYDQVDVKRVKVSPLSQRLSQLAIEQIALDPDSRADLGKLAPQVDTLVQRMRQARRTGSSRMLAYGAHLVKNGAAPAVIRLIQQGWLTHVATNGAGVIHDFEFSFLGRSSESVRENVATGAFGTWDETSRFIHLAVLAGAVEGRGYGESVGRMIAEEQLVLPGCDELAAAIANNPSNPATAARADLLQALRQAQLPPGRLSVPCPFRKFSILAQAFLAGVPATVHPGIGYDIIFTHPLASGAGIGRGGYIDFCVFAQGVKQLGHGVMLSVGSAIMAPQVFEKSMSVANNLLQQERTLAGGSGRVEGHTIAVVDLADGGGWDWSQGEPPKENPAYYLRFCKSYSRMGGHMQYLQMDNRLFLLGLCNGLGSGAPSTS